MPDLLDWRRRWLLRRAAPGPLADYLSKPLPRPGQDYRDIEYLALDLETTGLDPVRDSILSVGCVLVRGRSVELGSAYHRLVRIDRDVPEASAVIHRITDDQAAQGGELSEVMAEVLGRLAGRVLIAHFAGVEKGFLARACRRLWRSGLPMRVVDTQALAQRTLERRQMPYKPGDLRLHALGARYNLPRYSAHNALYDALAAAELFLAQAAHRDGGRRLPLRDFLT